MQFTIYQESRQGDRAYNQDRIGYTYSREALLLVVADGMGGHANGDIAAQICVQLLIDGFHREAKPVLINPGRFLRDAMLRVHDALLSYANQRSLDEAPRTTCVACVVQGGYATWAHVGDSRCYLIRSGQRLAVTVDHSKVQFLVDQGIITAGAALTHPERNQIYSCLGGTTDPVLDVGDRVRLATGDLVVLCTDGLWSVVPEDELIARLNVGSVLEAGPALIAEAERRGGGSGDNVSAIFVRWGAEDVVPSRLGRTMSTETMAPGQFETRSERP
jgi:serine/threonine protein phosphatase PrpC